jgi:hypothetical protein
MSPSTTDCAAGSGQPRRSRQPPQATGGLACVASVISRGTTIGPLVVRGSPRVDVANDQQLTAALLPDPSRGPNWLFV